MNNEPMPDQSIYDEWVSSRRTADAPRGLTDRVMTALEQRVVHRKHGAPLADRINESRSARLAACLAALLVGCLPFLFVAYVAQSFAF